MPRKERTREPLAGSPTLEYFNQRMSAGWRLVAMEWERDLAEDESGAGPRDWVEEIPYGLQVSDDGTRLVENPAETEVIILALDMIVEDCPLSRVADELTRRGYQTREGVAWNSTALFSLLPRMIQLGPRLFASEQWQTRRQRLPKVSAI